MTAVLQKIFFAVKLIAIYFAVAIVIGLAVWSMPFSPRGSLTFRKFSDSGATAALVFAAIAFIVGLTSALVVFFILKSNNPNQPVTVEALFNQQELAMKKAAAFGKRYYFQIMIAVILFAMLVAVVDGMGS